MISVVAAVLVAIVGFTLGDALLDVLPQDMAKCLDKPLSGSNGILVLYDTRLMDGFGYLMGPTNRPYWAYVCAKVDDDKGRSYACDGNKIPPEIRKCALWGEGYTLNLNFSDFENGTTSAKTISDFDLLNTAYFELPIDVVVAMEQEDFVTAEVELISPKGELVDKISRVPVCPRPDPVEQYDVAVCAIFRDQAPFLKEWVEYHLMQEIGHFFLYNHKSVDQPEHVLKSYIQNRTEALTHCVHTFSRHATWLAYIDVDEFIVPTNPADTVQAILEREYYLNETVCVNLDCSTFGTNFYIERPAGLVTEKYTRACPHVGGTWNQRKAICRTIIEKTPIIEDHGPFYVENKVLVPQELMTINHYKFKSHQDFKKGEIKNKFFTPVHPCNEIEKLNMAPYIERLKERVYDDGTGITPIEAPREQEEHEIEIEIATTTTIEEEEASTASSAAMTVLELSSSEITTSPPNMLNRCLNETIVAANNASLSIFDVRWLRDYGIIIGSYDNNNNNSNSPTARWHQNHSLVLKFPQYNHTSNAHIVSNVHFGMNIAYFFLPGAVEGVISFDRGRYDVSVDIDLVSLSNGQVVAGLPNIPICSAADPEDIVDVSVCSVVPPGHQHEDWSRWIQHHLLAGIGHFFIYDHNSNARKTLSPFIGKGLVTYIQWKDEPITDAMGWTHCTYSYSHLSLWMAYLNPNEYLHVATSLSTLGQILIPIDPQCVLVPHQEDIQQLSAICKPMFDTLPFIGHNFSNIVSNNRYVTSKDLLITIAGK